MINDRFIHFSRILFKGYFLYEDYHEGGKKYER